jgi:hypothetical protein
MRFLSARQIATIAASAAVAAPVALAAPIEIGERNPAGGADARAETQIIGNTAVGSYGTRQSNKGAGGGAIYGCRARLGTAPQNPDVSTPCIRVNNLSDGKAFDFVFNTGAIGGIIQSGGSLLTPRPNAAPFVTNATAVAAGLNADRVDGQHASQLIAAARASTGLDAEKIGGLTVNQIIAAARDGGSTCGEGLVAAGDSCIEAAPRAAANFAAASAACGAAGRHLPNASTLLFARTLDGIDLGSGEMASDLTPGVTLALPDPLGNILTPTVYATVADDGSTGSSPEGTDTAFRCAVG